ncbi:MAG: type IV pilus assembly protein PilM [Candidatus Kerfeldbacteria bacterium]|nr:type IV pilus assembly protein PilM [Candidatus Kerfeldbacteria bacterium]
MSIFNYNHFNNLIGLDISDSKIRFIQFRQSGKNKYRIISFSEKSIPQDLIRSGTVSNPDAVTKLLVSMVKEPDYGKLQSKFVNFSVPEKRSFVKVVTVPLVPSDELAGTVRWGIEQNIPVNINEVQYDWHVVKSSPSLAKDKMQCMVAVSPKNIIDGYADIVTRAGLVPICAENESVAISRSLINTKTNPDASIMIIDLGRSRTNIIIFHNDAVQFSSSIEVSGNEMTRAVAHKLSLSFEDAEKIKILYGLDYHKGRGQIKSVLEPLMAQLVNKLKEYVQYYSEYMLGKKSITQVLLTGNVGKLSGIQQYLAAQLNIPISIGDSYTNIRVLKSHDEHIAKLNTASYSTAIGLALKKIL